jgi:mono/diheme cytochrome c family protein
MRLFLAFIIGIVATVVIGGVAAYELALNGYLVPPNADIPPSSLEASVAHKALHASVRREIAGMTDPVPMNAASMSAGVKLYAQNCAVCHGAADAKPSKLAQGFYIESPMLAKDGVTDDPEAETYWKLTHGIRFSAMPAFGTTLSDTERWQITQFVAHMDKLPAEVDAEWKRVPSVASLPVAGASSSTGSTSNELAPPTAPNPAAASSAPRNASGPR